LHSKKEKFVKIFNRPNKSETIALELPETTPYLVTDDKNSVLNSDANFDQVTSLISAYNSRNIFIIDEKEGAKYLRNLKEVMSNNSSDKLLEF
jgi:hypothetical protein